MDSNYNLSETDILVIKSILQNKKVEEIEGNKDSIINSARKLASLGIVEFNRTVIPKIVLTERGEEALKKGLPEVILFNFIKTNNKRNELEKSGLSKEEINAAIGVLTKGGFIKIDKDQIVILKDIDELNKKFEKLDEIKLNGIKNEYFDEFLKRGLIRIEEEEKINLTLTEEGKKIASNLGNLEGYVSNLNKEIIKNYKNYKFRAYDLNSTPYILYNGRNLVKYFIDEVRKIMFSLGFQEMSSNYVEEVFWNYDVMMFRQNHPDRDIQDTIYLDEKGDLDISILERVKEVYLNGIKGLSFGYGGKFDESESSKLILRGHTTATTFRYLYYVISKNLDKNYRFFSVSKVFRNEAIDFKHLREFYQIEGMIYEDGLSVRSLIGYIKEFYKSLGIDKIQVKPTYNPYTEPSFEIIGFYDKINDWVEIGNSGMFRKETLYPLGINKNVAGFGLALERALMLKYGIDDIRLINGSESDLDIIRKYKAFKLW